MGTGLLIMQRFHEHADLSGLDALDLPFVQHVPNCICKGVVLVVEAERGACILLGRVHR